MSASTRSRNYVRRNETSLIQVGEALGQGVGILVAGLLSSLMSLNVLLNAQGGCYVTCALIALAGLARPRRRRITRTLATAP